MQSGVPGRGEAVTKEIHVVKWSDGKLLVTFMLWPRLRVWVFGVVHRELVSEVDQNSQIFWWRYVGDLA